MPKNPHQEQILETVAHLVAEDEVRSFAADAVDDVESEIKELKQQIDDKKIILAEKREELHESEQRCLALVSELKMLTDGKPRLPHITPTLPTDSPDPAAAHSVQELTRYGLSEKQIEKLTNSQLAAECPMKSVQDFMTAISKDEWWHRKIKGWGESARDKATEAITKYREEFPVPDGDERIKQCGKCSELYPQSKKKCPSCKATAFELVDPNDIPGEQMTMDLPDGDDTFVDESPEMSEMPEEVMEELEPVEA